jgi:hypothetical protein
MITDQHHQSNSSFAFPKRNKKMSPPSIEAKSPDGKHRLIIYSPHKVYSKATANQTTVNSIPLHYRASTHLKTQTIRFLTVSPKGPHLHPDHVQCISDNNVSIELTKTKSFPFNHKVSLSFPPHLLSSYESLLSRLSSSNTSSSKPKLSFNRYLIGPIGSSFNQEELLALMRQHVDEYAQLEFNYNGYGVFRNSADVMIQNTSYAKLHAFNIQFNSSKWHIRFYQPNTHMVCTNCWDKDDHTKSYCKHPAICPHCGNTKQKHSPPINDFNLCPNKKSKSTSCLLCKKPGHPTYACHQYMKPTLVPSNPPNSIPSLNIPSPISNSPPHSAASSTSVSSSSSPSRSPLSSSPPSPTLTYFEENIQNKHLHRRSSRQSTINNTRSTDSIEHQQQNTHPTSSSSSQQRSFKPQRQIKSNNKNVTFNNNPTLPPNPLSKFNYTPNPSTSSSSNTNQNASSLLLNELKALRDSMNEQSRKSNEQMNEMRRDMKMLRDLLKQKDDTINSLKQQLNSSNKSNSSPSFSLTSYPFINNNDNNINNNDTPFAIVSNHKNKKKRSKSPTPPSSPSRIPVSDNSFATLENNNMDTNSTSSKCNDINSNDLASSSSSSLSDSVPQSSN